jgi:hypothetical protein
MAIFIRNLGSTTFEVQDLGVSIDPLDPYELIDMEPSDVSLSAIEGDLNTAIQGGTIIAVNPRDNVSDLSIADSIEFLSNHNAAHYNMPPQSNVIDCVDVNIDPLVNFPSDYLTWDGNQVNALTPNDGVVKVNNILAGVSVTGNAVVDVTLTNNAIFSTSTEFPKNFSNLFPGQTPFTNPNTFVQGIYDVTTSRWLENPIPFQVHDWRIQINYTRGGTQANRELICRLRNPDTSFEIQEVKILPNGTQFQTNTLTYNLSSIADSASIGAGYILELQTVNAALTINEIQLVRKSNYKSTQ